MKRRHPQNKKNDPGDSEATKLRIIGGTLGGQVVKYSGDARTRPMKNRVREAMFNLVGPWVKETYTLDLFAGTGAVAFESISRGSVGALLVEKHFPTVHVINENVRHLNLETITQVVSGDAFHWVEHRMADEFAPPQDVPWSLFFCPPYSFFVDRKQEMVDMMQTLTQRAPAGSHVIVEFDEHFDPQDLPQPELWDVRTYAPAIIAVKRGTRTE